MFEPVNAPLVKFAASLRKSQKGIRRIGIRVMFEHTFEIGSDRDVL